ncbi:MAG: hypothetical protein QOH53_633, partial [Ilumatobacteraceae bacterium]
EPITDDVEAPPSAGRQVLRVVLLVVIAVAALAIAGSAGWLARGGSDTVSASSVDAGFARDMSTHHTQAVTMAGYERDNTTNPALKVLAFDIETSQETQVGEMSGWLVAWGLSRAGSNTPMSWMAGHGHVGADGLMPGMATPEQMNQLETAHGTALDILFLQLMIHHHQGGLPMAQYAEEHASKAYVRALAGGMVVTQTNEIVQMEQLLRQLGGDPLPPPAS